MRYQATQAWLLLKAIRFFVVWKEFSCKEKCYAINGVFINFWKKNHFELKIFPNWLSKPKTNPRGHYLTPKWLPIIYCPKAVGSYCRKVWLTHYVQSTTAPKLFHLSFELWPYSLETCTQDWIRSFLLHIKLRHHFSRKGENKQRSFKPIGGIK